MRYAIILFAVCLLGVMPKSSGVVNTEKRVIDIVYDNSGSMTFEDIDRLDKKDNYITRWVDADYAVRAFSALMEEGDHLYLFPMDKNREAVESGRPEEEVHYYEISGPEDEDIDKASKSFGSTYYAGVENALMHLQTQTGEKWIIVLTDSADKGMWEITLNEALAGVSDVRVLYVPIAELSERLSLSADIEDKVIQIESESGKNNIFSQILETTDYIYKRNSLTLSTEASGTVEFKIDAPVKELIVLMQSEGETVDFINRTSGYVNQDLKEKADTIRQEIEAKTGLPYQREKSFQSYSSENEPAYSHPEFASHLQIKDIQGEMISFSGKSTIDEENIFQKIVSVKANESVNVYYQLDIGIEIAVLQDGEPVEGSDIFEGEYEVFVYPVNPNSGKRVALDAQMLKDLSVKVNGEDCRFGESIRMEAAYPGTVSLEVSAEGAALEQTIREVYSYSIQERSYPLVIQVLELPDSFDYDKMNRNSIKNGEAEGIRIKLAEDTGDGLISLRDTTLDNLELEGVIDYKGLKKSEKPRIAVEIDAGTGADDEYLLYPYLTNEDDFYAYRDVTCNIVAQRKDDKEQSRASEQINLLLEAEPAVLEAELSEEGRYTGKDLAYGDVSYSLTCNGEEIPEGEWKNISFHTLEGGSRYISFKQTDGLTGWLSRLRKRIHWLYNWKETAYIHSEIIYMRRGIANTAVLEGEIQVILAPFWLRAFLYTVSAGFLLFFVYLAGNIVTGRCFLPFFSCTLYYCNDPEAGIQIKQKKWQCFCQIVNPKKGVLFHLSEGQRERYGVEFPDLIIQKRKRRQYYLKNWSVYSRQDSFRINKRYIYRENAVMSKEDQFEFMDSGGLWHTIVFQKNLITGEDGAK